MNCIFCKIIRGALPCRVYEDDDALAFMDIGPIVKGHLLVVPKQHYVNIEDTPVALLQTLIKIVQKIAMAQKRALKADGVNIMQSSGRAAGQAVDHFHFHIIPRFITDGSLELEGQAICG